MIRIFRRRKSKESLIHLFDLPLEHPSSLSTSSSNKVRKLKVQTLSILLTYPRSKLFVSFRFNPAPAQPVPVPLTMTTTKPLFNCQARRRSKKQKMNHTRKDNDVSTDFLLGFLDSLPLPGHYKKKHLLDYLGDLPLSDLPAIVEPVL